MKSTAEIIKLLLGSNWERWEPQPDSVFSDEAIFSLQV